MCLFDDLPFSETHLFTPSVSSYALCFQKKKKKTSIFRPISPIFGKISAPNTLILQKFVPKTLVFKEKKSIL